MFRPVSRRRDPRTPLSSTAVLDSDAATDLEIDLGLAASVRDAVAAEKRASNSLPPPADLSSNPASNRSLTPAPVRKRRLSHAQRPGQSPPTRDEAVETGVIIVLSAMVLIGGLALAGVLGIVIALAATLVV